MSDTLIPPLAADHAAAPRNIAPITGEALAQRAARIREEVGKAFIGQAEALDHVLIALLAGAPVAGWALALVVIALAAVNLLFGFCAGCFIFFQLQRLRR